MGVTEPRGAPPIVTLSDDVVLPRPWARSEASFILEASRDPAIGRYNSPPHSVPHAVEVIESFERNWHGFAVSGDPSGVGFAIVDVVSGELAGNSQLASTGVRAMTVYESEGFVRLVEDSGGSWTMLARLDATDEKR